jgi:hypothetical protein
LTTIPADALPGSLTEWIPWTGEQFGRGFAAYTIAVEGEIGDLTAEQAQELAAALARAADILDRADGTAPPFM